MKNKFFESQGLWIMLFLSFFTSCEQEDNILGYNIVGDGAAQFEQAYVDLNTENIIKDTLRSDRKLLINATVGAFQDPIFGTTKSSYYSQVRLSRLSPEFGDNAVVDSVVLSVPVYAITSDTIAYDRNLYKTTYTLDNATDGCVIKDTLTQYQKTLTYKMDSIYGNRNATMTLRVHRVTENMGTIDSVYYSDKNFQAGELFGSKVIDDKVIRNTLIQQTNGNVNDSVVISQDINPAIKMKLEGMKTFVQEQIVNQEGSANLNDQISFITNVLQGIKIDVAENDGFIINMAQAEMTLVAYISSDNPDFIDANGNGVHDEEEGCPVVRTLPTQTETLSFVVGSNPVTNSNKYYNVTQNAIENFGGSIVGVTDNSAVDFLQGMGGAKIRLTLNPNQIEEIRGHVNNDGWVINEAHIKVYPETTVQSGLPLPSELYLYNASQNLPIADYVSPLPPADFSDHQGFPFSQISVPYDSDKGYYLLRCTQYIKNMVDKNEPIDDLMLEMGNYLGMEEQNLFFKPESPFNSNRLFNPYRLAIVGNNPNAVNLDKKLQLEIYYSIKN